MLPCDKTLSFVYNNKGNHVYFTQFHKNGPQRADIANLLTASGMLVQAFPCLIADYLLCYWIFTQKSIN